MPITSQPNPPLHFLCVSPRPPSALPLPAFEYLLSTQLFPSVHVDFMPPEGFALNELKSYSFEAITTRLGSCVVLQNSPPPPSPHCLNCLVLRKKKHAVGFSSCENKQRRNWNKCMNTTFTQIWGEWNLDWEIGLERQQTAIITTRSGMYRMADHVQLHSVQ